MSRAKRIDRERALSAHRATENLMQGLAKGIEKILPKGIVFTLVTFTEGDGGYAGYVSNGRRPDMIKALRECADKLEAKRDMPPGASLDTH
jgi:hypothetical protein